MLYEKERNFKMDFNLAKMSRLRGVSFMAIFFRHAFKAICLLSCVFVCADERSVGIASEKQIPQNSVSATKKSAKPNYVSVQTDPGYQAFTGKVVGSTVRLRLHPDVDSQIVKELVRDELLVVTGEKNDFYAVEPPSTMKAYIFRSFVLDNVVEGARVNVRLAPELNAPVIGYMNTGDKVCGTISEKNHKWLEIAIPKSVRFFVAKEYLEKIGGPDLKATRDKKRDEVSHLMDSADLMTQSEMMKPFEELDFSKVSDTFNAIANNYKEFPEYAEKAKAKLLELQEAYLQKKLAYLESKTAKMNREMSAHNAELVKLENTELTPKDRMKIWERLEESYFLSWSAKHHQKTMDDYYEEQKTKAVRISGVVESYNDVVMNKPGNYILRERDMPKCYLYSTFVNLQNYVGKYVTVSVSPRPNNNFAFPAYFVMEVE